MGQTAGRGERRSSEPGWLRHVRLPGQPGDPWPELAATVLPRHLVGQRWYAAKDAGLPEVEVTQLIGFPPPLANAAMLAVLRVTPPGQASQRYQLPLLAVPEAEAERPVAVLEHEGSKVALVDASENRAFAVGLAAAFAGDDPCGDAGVVFRTTERFAEVAPALAEAEPKPGAAEQSNSSIRYGGAAILKLFRQLEPGTHPELEVGRFLTEVAGFANTPPLLGWVEMNAEGQEPAVLGVLQRLIPEAKDGWSHLLERLREAAHRGAGEDLADAGMLDLAGALGRRTAELHWAFATATEDPAFAPEPVGAEVLGRWGDAARAMTERALDALARAAVAGLEPSAQTAAQSLLARRDTLLERIAALVPERLDAARTRLHGDFHLGQVIVTGGDAFIIDFEGEPMRSLEERRAKHSPLRDVAGMLRSFAYAAASIGREGSLGADRLETWRAAVSAVFLDAYWQAVSGCESVPADRAEAERLLRLFLLEKALYEIGYELANRPDWVSIPVAGVLALLDGDAGSEAGDPADVGAAHAMPFGAEVCPDGQVRFRLWAPAEAEVHLVLDTERDGQPMAAQAEGWHELVTDLARPGSRYRFRLGSGQEVPDPASRFQPEDVHGPSEVVDPAAYRWRETGWRGRPWHEAVLYELHVGAFTPEGTFRAAIGKLDHLVALGATAVELMPVADFPGRRNWGYDGVLPYAPDATYGRPDDLKALVDAAHARGLMVFLDVVYNHFGPEGNYFGLYAPALFTDRHQTPWGAAVNFDGPGSGLVRDFIVHNALYWLDEFRFDGLRLDAVHAILDDSPRHLLAELAERARERFGPDRHVHLVLENDANQARFIDRTSDLRPTLYAAQWADDLHHGLHVAATGETAGYYADHAGDLAKLGRALAEGFAFQGEPSPFKGGERRGEASAHLPPTAFVGFLQNHDQVGNRALGDRIVSLAPTPAVRAVASLYLLSPTVPMLFMGEEWGTAQPFPFFCDFGPELADAVRRGRREEFAGFPEFSDPTARERIPDPTAAETFELAKLPWSELEVEVHAGWLAWYRSTVELRHQRVVPLIPEIPGNAAAYALFASSGLEVWWRTADGRKLRVLANLSAEPLDEAPPVRGGVIRRENGRQEERSGGLAPWEVVWSLEEPSALDRLALRMGIEPSYGDAVGKTVHASDETKRALLAAMGVDAADEASAQERLEEIERAELARVLPPVQVIREDRLGSASAPLNLPAGTLRARWTLIEERGVEREGEVEAAALDLALLGPLASGYHRLRIEAGERRDEMSLIVAPARCYLPPPLERGERVWGISAQVYTICSALDWGMGDFGDLANLVGFTASRGAAVVAVNPLHALFLDRPEQASPYSPASRSMLNPLYIDVMAIPELTGCGPALATIASSGFQERVEALRAEPLVDYRATAELKLPLLETLYRRFRQAALPERQAVFASFRAELGQPLEDFCLFQALRERFAAEDSSRAAWQTWPEPFRNPRSAEVRRFREEHRDRVEFFAWLQWIADGQLAAAAARGRELGVAVGICRDLAVGADAAGAETWANPEVVVAGAAVGAPPDIFNPAGQNWGLPPFAPAALRTEAYRSFVDMVRANMRHAGALRIDHILGLQHFFWIPAGRPAGEGAYVAYPLEDLLGILALESHRHRCLVVGEDLGTVPKLLRERMPDYNVLGYRVVFFEWTETGSFRGPEAYSRLAFSTIASHDLATLRGWWEGRDIDAKAQRGLYPAADEEADQRRRRAADRGHLVDALRAARLSLPAAFSPESSWSDALGAAAHAFLARTRSAVAMVQLDDLAGESDQVNLPGTTDEYPNWRRKLSLTLDELAEDEGICMLLNLLAAARTGPAGDA